MVLGYNMKLITIESQCELPELGGVMGPIKSPLQLSIPKIIALINRGVVVYDVNPKNKKDRVRLTTSNVKTDNFIAASVKSATKAKDVMQRTTAPVQTSTNSTKNNEKSNPDKSNTSKEKKSENTAKVTSPDFTK